MSTPGRFVWHDLMTTDLARARLFYAELLGWRYQMMDLGAMGQYPMILAGQQGIGGMVQLDPRQEMPSHWIAYVTVEDVAAAARRAEAAGGRVCVPPATIPGVGVFAVLEDPTGAYISPYVPASAPGAEPEGVPAPGTVVWNELLTPDAGRAQRFYESVFGWAHGSLDMGEMGEYHLFRREDKDVAGMMQMPPEATGRPIWMPYFGVEDVDAAEAKAVALGACSFVRPQDIPGIGRFAVLADPAGASFALFRGGM